MSLLLPHWQIQLAFLYSFVNERQQQVVKFQNAQIQFLMNQLGMKRLLLSDDQRRVFAVKAHALGRKALLQLNTIFTVTFTHKPVSLRDVVGV